MLQDSTLLFSACCFLCVVLCVTGCRFRGQSSLYNLLHAFFHLQSWADAFRSSSSLSGVVHVYDDLRRRGLEFPMTDLDALSPIHTPNRVRLSSSEKTKHHLNVQIFIVPYLSDKSCRAPQKMEPLRSPLSLLLRMSHNWKLLQVFPFRIHHLHFSPVKDQSHFLQNRFH